jgi:succinate dehydrogenase/fumarate reductase cytochrome b subunit
MFNGLIGLVILIADLWAIVQVFQSRESNGTKVLWAALIIVLPVLGLIIWYFAGPRGQGG